MKGRASRGFTLVELVMVIVLVGILSAYALPKLVSGSDFDSRVFHDRSLAMLRFAHKEAIAQRRLVCVTFTTNSISIVANASAAALNCSSPVSIATPGGSTIQSKGSITYTTKPISFNFDALGRPVNPSGMEISTQIIQVTGVTKSIKIESSTGYAHE